jgi:CheY-like chemotaxis protein
MGIAELEAATHDVLVCDPSIPDEDGIHLLARIRARDAAQGGDVPAIALTALASDEDRRRAISDTCPSLSPSMS